jgi:hypothetical protein
VTDPLENKIWGRPIDVIVKDDYGQDAEFRNEREEDDDEEDPDVTIISDTNDTY